MVFIDSKCACLWPRLEHQHRSASPSPTQQSKVFPPYIGHPHSNPKYFLRTLAIVTPHWTFYGLQGGWHRGFSTQISREELCALHPLLVDPQNFSNLYIFQKVLQDTSPGPSFQVKHQEFSLDEPQDCCILPLSRLLQPPPQVELQS